MNGSPHAVSTPTNRPGITAAQPPASTGHHDWIVAQLGAREHYAVPRALDRANRLDHFFTDAWCRWGRSVLRHGPALARAFANRYHDDLSEGPVTSFNGMAVRNVLRRRRLQGADAAEQLACHHADVGRRFGEAVTARLRERSLSPDRHAFFGFAVGSLEIIRHLNERGLLTVVDQISPGPVERRIVAEEARRWPEWTDNVPESHPVLEDRVAREWGAADRVLVNSEWSRTALRQEGVPDEKLIVVPGAYEPPEDSEEAPPSPRDGPLRVLWLGNVILRKGIPYLAQAAAQLTAANVEFQIVGPIGITDAAVAKTPDNMTFVGPVSRNQTSAFYRRADVFAFPTLSDGFGLTQLEAMAHGCPVIATPRCGRVVTDGEDGFIVPPRDPEALADAVEQLLADRERLRAMSTQARQTAQTYTLDAYAHRLFAAVDGCVEDS
jgi:glycosyltransferase involved in cell wall biosynthesis